MAPSTRPESNKPKSPYHPLAGVEQNARHRVHAPHARPDRYTRRDAARGEGAATRRALRAVAMRPRVTYRKALLPLSRVGATARR
eukprot:1344610-Prymnesium_polylepis.1